MLENRSLALNKLVKDNEMLSEIEVASVVAPLLERLKVLHAAGKAHGNVSLATVMIRVVEPADGTIHLPHPSCCNEAAHRPCAACQQTEESSTAADIWSVGVIALQLLLGRPCREGCHSAISDKHTGEMPVLPRGTSLECIDFLMDCLAPYAEERAGAEELLKHDFLRVIAPRGPKAPDAADSLADSLADVLLISTEGKNHEQACRPCQVPGLKAKGRVFFTEPSHTARCQRCRCKNECVHEDVEAQIAPALPRIASDLSLKLLSACTSPKLTPNAAGSAASTKRKLGTRNVPSAPLKRQCSGLVKYLSPAIRPMTPMSDLENAPALILEFSSV